MVGRMGTTSQRLIGNAVTTPTTQISAEERSSGWKFDPQNMPILGLKQEQLLKLMIMDLFYYHRPVMTVF